MDAPIHLGLAPTLLFHASGAVTFIGDDAGGWEDEAVVLAVVA